VSFGGLFAGLTYFSLSTLDTALQTINVTIPMGEGVSPHPNLTSIQDILGIVVYPILGLRSALPYLTYFMVFAFIIALGMTAYLTSKNPIFFVVHLLFTILMTYFCIILSNTYTTLISNPFINQIMTPFTIYNKLMLFLPQIVFFTALVFGVIAFINIMKPPTSDASSGLQYGGDY
jgi:hypothetical protein